MSEPWCPIPLDLDPECPNCGRDAWNDDESSCGYCGWQIEDVAETIAAQAAKED